MTKGNKTNHKKVYARQEDLKELKERFFNFIDNDFRHLQLKVAYQSGILYVLLALLAIIIAKIFGAF